MKRYVRLCNIHYNMTKQRASCFRRSSNLNLFKANFLINYLHSELNTILERSRSLSDFTKVSSRETVLL